MAHDGMGDIKFQSTHPTRGCDVIFLDEATQLSISIHAPHEGVRLVVL